MTDESPEKRSDPEPDAATPSDSIGDESVAALLDRASALASEMATELGDASPEQQTTRAEETLADRSDLAKSLDEELDQMDTLAQQVGDQVGGDEPDDSTGGDPAGSQSEESDAATPQASEADQALSEAAAALDQSLSQEIDTLDDPAAPLGEDGSASSAPPLSDGAEPDGAKALSQDNPIEDSPDNAGSEHTADTGVAEGAESEVPDFMKEFLEPDEPKTPPADEPSSGGSAGAPSAAATPEQSFDDDLTAPPVESPGAGASAGKASEDGAQVQRGKLAALLALAPILTRKSTSALCAVLEIADRPFGMVPARVRTFIGLAALATLATSAVVLAIAMF